MYKCNGSLEEETSRFVSEIQGGLILQDERYRKDGRGRRNSIYRQVRHNVISMD